MLPLHQGGKCPYWIPSLPDDNNGEMPAARDDVDLIIEAWLAERPDLDVSALGIFSRVGRLGKHLERIRRSAFRDHDLDVWAFEVLATLRRAGEPYRLSPSELIEQTMVTSGAMTNRIHRLVERGLVTRVPDSDDGRRAFVSLTPAGQELVDRALADLLKAEERILAGLGGQERKELQDLLRALSLQVDLDEPTQT